jgi:hypothetical protein
MNFINCIKVKNNEVDRACSTKQEEENCIWDISGKVRREETN